MKIFEKLFLSGYYFTIAVRRKKTCDTAIPEDFAADFTMKADLQHWAADPMLADCGGKTYLFYEAVEGTKGHIAVREVKEDCSLGDPVVILKDENHYSYPFVFFCRDAWYMIPESSSANEIRLYKARSFPCEWEKVCILAHGQYVDTTVFEDSGSLYLLTYEINGITECVIPKAFRFHLEQDACSLEEIPWPVFDELKVRGAGPVMHTGTGLVRPAQVSTAHRYGDAVAFCSIDECREEYAEHIRSVLTADSVKTGKPFVDGLHTYCASAGFEAIDVRCRDFDIGKPLRKLFQYLKR